MIAALVTQPAELTAPLRRALNLMAAGVRMYRHGHSWGRGIDSVSGETGRMLLHRGLARVSLNGRKAELVLTYAGKATHAVLAAQAERRRA